MADLPRPVILPVLASRAGLVLDLLDLLEWIEPASGPAESLPPHDTSYGREALS